ncbi:MAG: type II secretion system F family protein [Halobacteriota archaeon]
MIRYVPLGVAIVLCSLVVLPALSSRIDLLVSRLSLAAFGNYVASGPRKANQLAAMRAAHVDKTHRLYASRTLFFSGILGVAGGVIGVYVATATLWVLEVGDEPIADALPPQLWQIATYFQLESLSIGQLFVLFLLASSLGGGVLALGTYWFRWYTLSQRAEARRSKIEATLPRTIAFIYALSRSGMAFPEVLETLSENEAVYGEAARETTVAVTDMKTFGTDVITAIERMAERTPSEGMSELGENLASVLASGQNLSAFLREQYEQYQQEAQAQQRQYLDLLSTFAEAYVTVLVAGPLFFITILVVIGLVLEDTLPLVRVISYVGIPLATVGFVVYVDSVTQSLRTARHVSRGDGDVDMLFSIIEPTAAGDPSTDWQPNRDRLQTYDRIERVLGWLTRPGRTVLANPWTTAIVTVPVGLVWVGIALRPLPTTLVEFGEVVAGPLIEASIVTLGTYALVYEFDKRRRRRLESEVPDFLDRLASVNEAGMTVIESFRRTAQTELGSLTAELERTWNDIQWGASAQVALNRFERRTRSPAVKRSIALIGNALRTSGDIGPVVSIAADEARASRQLERERRQEMLTYLVVIYIAFLVFLGIIAALSVSFIPAIEGSVSAPGDGGVPGGVGGGIVPTIGGVDSDAYVTLFYHVTAIQGVCSGLVAGQLGEGGIRDGVKHATILLLLAYVAFLFI